MEGEAKVVTILYGRTSIEDVKNWLKENGLDKGLMVLVDYEGRFFQEYGIRGVPTTIIFDKDGKPYKTLMGALPLSVLKSVVKDVLSTK